MWKCPKCEIEGRGGSRICRQCGAILVEVGDPEAPGGVATTSPARGMPGGNQVSPRDEDREHPASLADRRDRGDRGDRKDPEDQGGRSDQGDQQDRRNQQNPGRSTLEARKDSWQCAKCRERHPQGALVCWKCGTDCEGNEDPSFVPVDEVGSIGAEAPGTEARAAGYAGGVPVDLRQGASRDVEGSGEGAGFVGGERVGAAPRLHGPSRPWCARCGSRRILTDLETRAQGDSGSGPLQVVVYENPEAVFFRSPFYAELRAQVCADCGHVELRTPDAAELYRKHLESKGGGEGPAEGPDEGRSA